MALVLSATQGHTGIITLNHSEKRNALSEALVHELIGVLDDFRHREIRAVILRAQPGIKVWSAGHDVNELPGRGRDPLGWNDPLRILIRTLQEYPAPIIGLIEGSVWGGACEVAMACDILVITPDVSFAITPAKMGVPYNIGGLLTLLNMIPLPIVKEMLFTAEPLPSDQAFNLGIVNYVKPADEIEAFVGNIADRIALNSPLSIGVMKDALRLLSSAHAVSPELFERIQGMRRIVYDSEDYQEGIRAFREKRKPKFPGK
ncbi:methylmalonyl-CoA decarboxylase [Propionivibrio dicarboxylicus]|uniref:Methylmalonyl-CoA decarboxylase n=1 Tax=Propionivibrio dicarboxylicus TaxID=83767 RepID=A0A1G7Y425_9RHOO|nr:methylmalonyl-CoA decarboxylase [Propionivibrio dicarboxylicus]SDG91191.1 methylmalonyl-CoA decarboxylase [Propionivibrio dicarboxylicus]